MSTDRKTISRRKVAAGMAWSVPAVAAVSAAPFAAASPLCPEITAVGGDVFKYAGNNSTTGTHHGYGFEVTITNVSGQDIRVTPGTASIMFDKKGEPVTAGRVRFYDGDPCNGGKEISLDSDKLVLAPNKSITLWYVLDKTGNSSNESGCITAEVNARFVTPTPAQQGQECPGTPVEDKNKAQEICFDETPPTC